MAVLLLGATGNVGPHVARALPRRGDDLVRVRFVTPDVERVPGRAPRTVEDHLQELTVPSRAV